MSYVPQRQQRQPGVVTMKPNGVILYRGPSRLDRKPIACVATGLARGSRNPKTGPMIQTWIFADSETDPVSAAFRTGADVSVCGDCPLRPKNSGACYVNLLPVNAVWRALGTGAYPVYYAPEHAHLFRGRHMRFGSYGDPAAVPLYVWKRFTKLVSLWTGYTHQWRTCHPGYARICMASVETEAQAIEARAKGYRTFRVRAVNQPVAERDQRRPRRLPRRRCRPRRLPRRRNRRGRRRHPHARRATAHGVSRRGGHAATLTGVTEMKQLTIRKLRTLLKRHFGGVLCVGPHDNDSHRVCVRELRAHALGMPRSDHPDDEGG